MTKQVFVTFLRSVGEDELFGEREGTQHHSVTKKRLFYLCLFLRAEELTLVVLLREEHDDGIRSKKQ